MGVVMGIANSVLVGDGGSELALLTGGRVQQMLFFSWRACRSYNVMTHVKSGGMALAWR